MILKNRFYTRVEPTRDARLFIIYCEGEKREKQYFNYFSEISSQIRLEVEAPSQNDNNSPTGLYQKAESQICNTENDSDPKYELSKNDEVWFVIDTDTWLDKISQLKSNCESKKNWFVAQSNPCFEVWLFYHFCEFMEFNGMEISANWKAHLHEKLKSGFDSRKHPIFIQTAIQNSKEKYEKEHNEIKIGCTEVFKLAENFFPLVKRQIEHALSSIL